MLSPVKPRSLGILAKPLLRKCPGKKPAVEDAAPHNPLALAFALVAFVASGISQPLLMSAVRFAGLGDTTCQLYMLPYYVGMACTGLLATNVRWTRLPLHRCVCIALVGIVSQNLNFAGNMYAGSGIFAVIYASVTIWNAMFARIFLQRVLTVWQWCAVLAVVLGLVITQRGARNDGPHVWEGACMVGVGALLHALSHVLSELVSVRGQRVPAQVNCAVQGLTACAVIATWQCGYTAFHMERISGPGAAAGTTLPWAMVLMGALAAGNFVHAGTFFYLLTSIGSVSAGVLKGVQAVAVFTLAHVMYCDRDASQCITPMKGVALGVVVSGVVGYALATAAAKSSARVTAVDQKPQGGEHEC